MGKTVFLLEMYVLYREIQLFHTNGKLEERNTGKAFEGTDKHT